jgi:hypothetical protein
MIENSVTQRCPSCITSWVDHARLATGVRLTDAERRRLIAALLSRQHVILSGPAGTGKCQLAHTLALAMVLGRPGHVRSIQGHPWWAARTQNVAHYVSLQTEFSLWRLADFMRSAVPGRRPGSRPQAEGDSDEYVVCIERMSPVEVDFYFGAISGWLARQAQDETRPVSLRLIGTYDSDAPPALNDRILRFTALVHLSRRQNGRH